MVLDGQTAGFDERHGRFIDAHGFCAEGLIGQRIGVATDQKEAGQRQEKERSGNEPRA
jgi:hypothetical protein